MTNKINNELKGLIVKSVTYNKTFHKVFIINNGIIVCMIYKESIFKFNVNDFIHAIGYWAHHNNVEEFYAKKIILITSAKANFLSSDKYNKSKNIDYHKIQLFAIRSHATKFIHEYLSSNNYLQVQSPTIVSNWVDGKTKAFPVEYYKNKAFLSISNMLYHQMMIANGMNRIYELGKLHRMEENSGQNKLCEFTILDISQSFSSITDIMMLFENLIKYVTQKLRYLPLYKNDIITEVDFKYITYRELLSLAGVKDDFGSQLPSECKQYLNAHFTSFVWVTGFNSKKRPFYSKIKDGYCLDAQLWYRGQGYLAAGTEVEDDIDKILYQIHRSDKNVDLYIPYINELKTGYPPVTMIGLGFEMLLSYLVINGKTADFAWFPRYENLSYFQLIL